MGQCSVGDGCRGVARQAGGWAWLGVVGRQEVLGKDGMVGYLFSGLSLPHRLQRNTGIHHRAREQFA